MASNVSLNQGSQTVIAIPAESSTRLPDQNVIDITLGRAFQINRVELLVDFQLFNAFNSDPHDWWETLVVPAAVPDSYGFEDVR